MKRQRIKSVTVIGGSDPSCGAGIQADLFILNQLGVRSSCVVTAVTAQTERRFLSYETVSVRNFRAQLESVQSSSHHGIVKIGMLGGGRLIPPLITWLEKARPSFVIVDPVLESSTGSPLLDRHGQKLLRQKLIPAVDLITPNIPELEILTRMRIQDGRDLVDAGRQLQRSVQSVLIKGGHLPGPPLDLLIEGTRLTRFRQARIPGPGTHGTGCTLASAIAGYLALGNSLKEAVRKARRVVLRKLRDARRL